VATALLIEPAPAGTPSELTLLKERKFGPGCMEAWTREAEALNGRAVGLLESVARAVAS
jgi:hypothetical protein